VNRSAAGFGCLLAFLLPFAVVGGFATVQCVRAASQSKWSEAGFFAIFALTFGGLGFGGIAAALAGRRKLAGIEALQQQNPATLWNLISIPGAILGVRAAVREGKPAGYIALLFPMVGIGLLAWAVPATIRYRRFGASRFELSTRPGIVGHSLAGTVRTTTTLRPAEGFQVCLRCIRRITSGMGNNRSTSESTLWQEESRVQGQVSRDASGTTRRGTGIVFPAARTPGEAMSLTVFVLLWTVVVWFLVHSRAPVIFPIVFGASSCFCSCSSWSSGCGCHGW
jgi:hypothetical protein